MQILVAALALALALAIPAPASGADAPKVIELEVGEKRDLPGFRPLCDDPSVASLAGGTLEGLKVGETTCSISTQSPLGPRQVYRIVVVPPANPGGAGRSEG